jgi:cardiolipin synthase
MPLGLLRRKAGDHSRETTPATRLRGGRDQNHQRRQASRTWAENGRNRVYSRRPDGTQTVTEPGWTLLHTKIMVVDGAAALAGSSNVNRRSLDHDEEVAMVVIDQASVDLLDRQFTEDLQRSRQIDLSRWQRRSAPQRTLETAVTAIRRWL